MSIKTSGAGVFGAPTIIRNLKRYRDKEIPAGIEKGLKLAGLHLLRESQLLVPVDFGVLKASGFMRVQGKGLQTTPIVGYGAHYAVYVHENLLMKLRGQPRPPPSRGNYWDPPGRGQSKFLEYPARRDKNVLKNIVRDTTKAHLKKAGLNIDVFGRSKIV